MKYALVILLGLIMIPAHSATLKHYRRIMTPNNESYLVTNDKGDVIKEQGVDVQRPIASLSKLMVGLLASSQDLTEVLNIPLAREVQSVIPHSQKTLSRRDLLTLALVKSDNFAAQILCQNIDNCINAMNEKAVELGMKHTHYAEPTGLNKDNVSTATDLLKLMLVASKNEVISTISRQSTASINLGNKILTIRNTNPLTAKLDIILSKTGFTNPAGGCLVMATETIFGPRFYILLGSKNTKTRIPEMEKLYQDTKSVD